MENDYLKSINDPKALLLYRERTNASEEPIPSSNEANSLKIFLKNGLLCTIKL
jgi:hypothetical protein